MDFEFLTKIVIHLLFWFIVLFLVILIVLSRFLSICCLSHPRLLFGVQFNMIHTQYSVGAYFGIFTIFFYSEVRSMS